MARYEGSSPARAVCFIVPPLPMESARGYIARVADYNVHERHADALSHAGLGLKEVLGGRVDAKILDRIYGLDPEGEKGLWPQSLEPEGPGTVLVRDVELPTSLFRHHRRRLSIAGLRKSLHHRHAWTIGALSFCPESWDVLVEQCPRCDHTFAWGNGAFWCCDGCGIDLRQCRLTRIRREHRPALLVLAELFSPDASKRKAAYQKLPDFVRGHSLNHSAQFIRQVGRVIDTLGPRADARSPLPRNYPIVMWVGLDFLLNLEERVAELLQPTRQARARLSELRAQLKCAGPAGAALLAMLQPGRSPGVEEGVLDLSRAARQLCVGTVQARQLVDLGILPSCYTLGGGVRRRDSIGLAAVVHLQAQISNRISLHKLAVKTNVARKILVNLGRAGHLQIVDSDLTRLLFKEVQFQISAVENLKALKCKLSRCHPENPGRVRLRDLFSALGIGFKPWAGAILESADAGQLGSPETHQMNGPTLSIDVDWARRIVPGNHAWACREVIETESINLVDAEEYLNLLPRDISCLIAYGQLQRGGEGVTADSIRRCGGLFISTKEVAVRAGVQSINVAGLAARAGVTRPYYDCGFWPRTHIEAALGLPMAGSEAAVLSALSESRAPSM